MGWLNDAWDWFTDGGWFLLLLPFLAFVIWMMLVELYNLTIGDRVERRKRDEEQREWLETYYRDPSNARRLQERVNDYLAKHPAPPDSPESPSDPEVR